MLNETYETRVMFQVGEVFPPQAQLERVKRCRENKVLFKGIHSEFFHNKHFPNHINESLYISVNLASLICKKSSDFLFGEEIQVVAGIGDDTNEQKALDRIIEQNHLGILLYESAITNAYAGDSFIKVRYGQEYGGDLPPELDEHRVFIENVSPENVFPETAMWDKNKIKTFHIAVPYYDDEKEEWFLNVESHSAGKILYHAYKLVPLHYGITGACERWEIVGEIESSRQLVNTGVPVPLVVHVPNLAVSDEWAGIDDLTELHSLLGEINSRLTQIASILDKHSDPSMAIPSGLLRVDADGNAEFRVAQDKVFEVMGREDIIPQYITWDGKLDSAFKEIDQLIDLTLMTAEIPPVALGKDNSGTSGSSGLSIKWRMNSLLSKINRKRQYYNKGLKQIFYIAQKLEEAVGIADYEITVPNIIFQDGLPIDELEQANILNMRTGGAKTLSQKSAIMRLNNMTETQAEAELERIKAEQEASQVVAEPSIFNQEADLSGLDGFMEDEVELEDSNNSPEEIKTDIEKDKLELELMRKLVGKL